MFDLYLKQVRGYIFLKVVKCIFNIYNIWKKFSKNFFFRGTSVLFTTKSDRHNIAEILLKEKLIIIIYLKVRIYKYLSFFVCLVIFQISYSTKYIHVGKLHAWKKHRDDFWCATNEYEVTRDHPGQCWSRVLFVMFLFIINLSINVVTNGGINGAPGITHC